MYKFWRSKALPYQMLRFAAFSLLPVDFLSFEKKILQVHVEKWGRCRPYYWL